MLQSHSCQIGWAAGNTGEWQKKQGVNRLEQGCCKRKPESELKIHGIWVAHQRRESEITSAFPKIREAR